MENADSNNCQSSSDETFIIEVAYALPEKQLIVEVKVKAGTNMKEAVIQSKIADKFPEIDVENLKLGIFGKSERKPEERILEAGERIEIYRPLIADPKADRKKRAEKAKADENVAGNDKTV